MKERSSGAKVRNKSNEQIVAWLTSQENGRRLPWFEIPHDASSSQFVKSSAPNLLVQYLPGDACFLAEVMLTVPRKEYALDTLTSQRKFRHRQREEG
jgi:hypothetical protein